METRLVNKLAAKGFNVIPRNVQITADIEYEFAWTSYSMVKDLATTVSKVDKNLTLSEFFIKNYRRHFKNSKTIEEDVSRYISVMTLFSLGKEITLYRYMFMNEVNQKTCRIFIEFFNQIQKIQPNLYQNKLKILKHVKLDLRKALELGSAILRQDNAISAFTNLLSTHMESSKVPFNSITSETAAALLIEAYILTNNVKKSEEDEGGVYLNWDEYDGQTFTIEVNAGKEELVEQYNDAPDEMEETGQSLEKLNMEYRKALKHKDHANAKATPDNELNDHVIRICHRYVFDGGRQGPQEEELGEIDTQLISLNAKLAKQKAELELQESIWKMILNASKGAVKSYRGLKGEIQNLEGTTDALMNLLDKNTDEWRRGFVIKNNTVDKLKRYKFLIAAILESCGADLKKDLSEFRFAHDEDSKNMRSIFDQKQTFDFYEYLTSVYQLPKPNVVVSRLDEPLPEKTAKVVTDDRKKRMNSLAGKLERFEVSRGPNTKNADLHLNEVDEDFLDQPFTDEMIEARESFDVSESFIRNEEHNKKIKIQAMKEGLAKIKKNIQHGQDVSAEKEKLKHDLSMEQLTPNKSSNNSKSITSKRVVRRDVSGKSQSKKTDVTFDKSDQDDAFWSKINSCASEKGT